MSSRKNDPVKAKILLMTLVFAPDGVSTSVLLSELARQLELQGHEVAVVTTTPHYNRDKDALALQPLHARWGKLLWVSRYGSIPVYHAAVRPKGSRVLSRLLDYANFHLTGILAGLKLTGACDIVLAASPPLTVGLAAMLLARIKGAPFIYNVQEIYPDIAVRMGVLKNRFLILLCQVLERAIYRQASKIVVISESFCQSLMARGVPQDKIIVIPNFVDVNTVSPFERNNQFSHIHGLDNHFVVQYAGNIGLTQDFESLLQAAKLLENIPEICFLIVGDGAARRWLTAQIEKLELTNVRWLPYQPRHMVASLYASCDVCIVPMKRNMSYDTFPSKVYTIMAAGRPALVTADADSELVKLVEQSGCGIAIPPADASLLAARIRDLHTQKSELRMMGQRGRDYVVEYHSSQAITAKYHKIITSLI